MTPGADLCMFHMFYETGAPTENGKSKFCHSSTTEWHFQSHQSIKGQIVPWEYGHLTHDLEALIVSY